MDGTYAIVADFGFPLNEWKVTQVTQVTQVNQVTRGAEHAGR